MSHMYILFTFQCSVSNPNTYIPCPVSLATLVSLSGSYSFTTTSSYIYYSSLTRTISNELTISMFITTTTVNAYLVSYGRSWGNIDGEFVFQTDSNGYLYFWDHNLGKGYDGILSTTSVTTGNRTHVAFVKSGTTGSCYINGVLQGTISSTVSKTYVNSDLVIGKDIRGSVKVFYGTMDNIHVNDIAMSATEIYSLYSGVCKCLLMNSLK